MKTSIRDLKYDTYVEYFYHWVKETPNAPFLKQPNGDEWSVMTFKEGYDQVKRMVTAMRTLGLESGDHVAILSKNCTHWILADLAIMIGGYVSVPLYANASKETLSQIMELSDSKAVFVGKLESYVIDKDTLDDSIVQIKFPAYPTGARVTIGHDWDELIRASEPFADDYIPDPDAMGAILYTSGTTGTPKGVMHKHGTPLRVVHNETKHNWLGIFGHEEHRFFSFLPLNHVAEKMGIQAIAMATGGSVSFAESLDTFAKNLQDTQPTVFFAVPRIWTKFYQGVAAKIPLKRQKILFNIPIIGNIIKKKIRNQLGLTNVVTAVTGAAITPAYIKEWFKDLGIHLTEAYGQTECYGLFCSGPMKDCPQDSVGKPGPHGEARIDAATGEVLIGSPYLMDGYYKDESLTNRVIRDGWLHSGDKGSIDADGFLKIVGRVSDTFKTAKGEFITPNPIEESIGENEYIEQICLVGLTVPQPMAIVNLSESGLQASKAKVEESLTETLKAVNKGLNGHEKVSHIVVDDQMWNVDNQFLTPTLKVRRGQIDKEYGQKYTEWCQCDGCVVWKS